MQRARQALVVRTRYNDLVFVQSHGDGGGSCLVGELALRALNGDQVAIDLNLNAGGNRDGETSRRDIILFLSLPNRLPDVSDDFAAHALLRCLLVSEQTRKRWTGLRCRGHPEPGAGWWTLRRYAGLEIRRTPAMERSRDGPYLRTRVRVLPTFASSTLTSAM